MEGILIEFFERNTKYINRIQNEIETNNAVFKEKMLPLALIVVLKAICDPINIVLAMIFVINSSIFVAIPLLLLPITLVSLARTLDPTARQDSISRFLVFSAAFCAYCALPFLAVSLMPEGQTNDNMGFIIFMLVLVMLINTYRVTTRK